MVPGLSERDRIAADVRRLDWLPDAIGGVFVVDTNNHRVLKFTPGGAFIGTFESSGSGPGEFRLPLGIGVEGSGFRLRVRHRQSSDPEVRTGMTPSRHHDDWRQHA